jgi:hypothetical protein
VSDTISFAVVVPQPGEMRRIPKTPTQFLNVDVDLKSIVDPGPFVLALGSQVICQTISKTRRMHRVRLTLVYQPKGPADAILRFSKLFTKLPEEKQAIWLNAVSKEFDIGIQAGFEPTAAEWLLERKVVEAAAQLGAQVRITVYSSELVAARSRVRP